MTAGTGESASVISTTVEKAELVSAIGREIDRIDRNAASHGYTSWALWGALGVLAWKGLELLPKVEVRELALTYLLILIAYLTTRLLVNTAAHENSTGPLYFETVGKNFPRIILMLGVLGLCLAIHWRFGASFGWRFWVVVLFLAIPLLSAMAVFFARDVPVAKGWQKDSRSRLSLLFAVILIGLGMLAVAATYYPLAPLNLLAPTESVKVALLGAVATILAFRLAKNVEATDRRTSFQRLETDLTLLKVEVSEARDRYESLMIGMNVSAAVRPWVDAVMIPLEEASANVSEARQLLNRFLIDRNVEMTQAPNPLDVAVRDRIKLLLGNVPDAMKKSSKAHARLQGMCMAIFGSRDLASSPIAAENDRITESRKKVRDSLADIERTIDEVLK